MNSGSYTLDLLRVSEKCSFINISILQKQLKDLKAFSSFPIFFRPTSLSLYLSLQKKSINVFKWRN